MLVRRLIFLAILGQVPWRAGAGDPLEQGVPFYFAVPESAFLEFPENSPAHDLFVRAPVKGYETSPAGLRLVPLDAGESDRRELSRSLVAAGILRDGDVVLTFRPYWADTSAYQHLQMGISHSGLIFVEEGVAYNVDMPLDEKFNAARITSTLSSEHYRTASALHIVRPRGFEGRRAENLHAWVGLLRENLTRIREHRMLTFSVLYTSPNYSNVRGHAFLGEFASILKGEASRDTSLRMFCSEFVWSMLSLSGCSPSQIGSSNTSCIDRVIEPMDLFSKNIDASWRVRNAGLIEGPLLVLDRLGTEPADRPALIEKLFAERPVENASFGHRLTAAKVKPLVAWARPYYAAHIEHRDTFAISLDEGRSTRLTYTQLALRTRNLHRPNYPPTAFLINSFLPRGNKNRVFDYVATLCFE